VGCSRQRIDRCGLQFIHVTPEIEVTYGLAKTHWRKGLASEAARACLRYGFEQLKLNRIYALAEPGNTGSHRVMERVGIGMTRPSITRMTFTKAICYMRSQLRYYGESPHLRSVKR
jgi:RimJ/RimL family protein N-acetyltransferase